MYMYFNMQVRSHEVITIGMRINPFIIVNDLDKNTCLSHLGNLYSKKYLCEHAEHLMKIETLMNIYLNKQSRVQNEFSLTPSHLVFDSITLVVSFIKLVALNFL